MASLPQHSDSAKRLGQLAKACPQLESDLQQHQRRQIYGRPLKQLSSAASHYTSYRVYDVVFTSLRMIVFQIDPTSATPIAHIIRDELNDAQVFDLIENISEPTTHWKLGRKYVKSFATVHPDRAARYDALRRKMAEARIKHAEFLREEGLRDVDIIYKCSKYEVEPFKTDKEKIKAAGGRPYHMYPFRVREQEMALSVLITAETFATLFPAERCAEQEIIIKTNTAPAEPFYPAIQPILALDIPKPAGQDTMFPSWQPAPKPAGGTIFPPSQPVPNPTYEPPDAMAHTTRPILSRNRGDSIVDMLNGGPVPQTKPYQRGRDEAELQTKVQDVENLPPATQASLPVRPEVSEVYEGDWLQRDLAKHQKNLDIWDSQTWKTCKKNGTYHRHMSSKDARITVRGDDYPIMQPLSQIYTSQPDQKWYDQQDVVNAGLRDYKKALEAFTSLLKQTMQFYQHLLQCYHQAVALPQSEPAQTALKIATEGRILLQHRLNEAKITAVNYGQDCGQRPEAAQLLMPDQLEWKFQQLVKSQPLPPALRSMAQRQPSEATLMASPLGTAPRPPPKTPIKQVKTNNDRHGGHRRPAKTEAKSNSSHRDATPFPAYEDPLVEHGPCTGEWRSVAEVLNQTGVPRHVTFQFPNAQEEVKVMFGEPQSPITPEDWSGTAEGKENEAVPSSDVVLVRRTAVAGDESVPGSLMVEAPIR